MKGIKYFEQDNHTIAITYSTYKEEIKINVLNLIILIILLDKK